MQPVIQFTEQSMERRRQIMTRRFLSFLLAFLLLCTSGALAEASPESTVQDEEVYQQVLEALDNELFYEAYQFLTDGSVFKSGVKKSAAKGLQQLIVQLGEKTTVNGTVSGKTITALNKVQEVFGLAQEKTVNLDSYKQLLICALFMQDVTLARSILEEVFPMEQLDYLEASVNCKNGLFYTAQGMFENISYLDSAERAEKCVQKWPKNGQVYRNPDFKSTRTGLTIHGVADDGQATYIKIYTPDDVLVSTLFIASSNSASVRLPAGTYRMKVGNGTSWYGPEEAFGDDYDAFYSILTFDESGTDSYTFKSGKGYELTLGGVTDGNVGSQGEDWSSF
jgi:hypothetical protein